MDVPQRSLFLADFKTSLPPERRRPLMIGASNWWGKLSFLVVLLHSMRTVQVQTMNQAGGSDAQFRREALFGGYRVELPARLDQHVVQHVNDVSRNDLGSPREYR